MFPSENIYSEIIWRYKFLRASPFHMHEFQLLIHFLTGCDVRLTEGTCHRHGILVEAQPE